MTTIDPLPGQQEQHSLDLGNGKRIEWMKLTHTKHPMVSLSRIAVSTIEYRQYINLHPHEALLLLSWLQEQQQTLEHLVQSHGENNA
jgi:hypothetical protein